MGKIATEKLEKLPGAPVTRGRSAEIYDLGGNRVLKLYFAGFPESEVDLEYLNTLEANRCGCTPMKCFGKVEHEGRYGIVLQKVAGVPMTKAPEKNPLILFKAGRLIAEQHVMVQSKHTDALPDLREKAAACLDGEAFAFLSDGEREKIRSYILALPAGDSFIHLDFHTENILINGKDLVVIDWMTAAKGRPEAEVAMMDFLHHHAELFPGSSKAQLAFYTAVRAFIYNSFLKNYVRLTGMAPDAHKPWMIVALVLRKGLWNIESEKDYLEGEIRRLADAVNEQS